MIPDCSPVNPTITLRGLWVFHSNLRLLVPADLVESYNCQPIPIRAISRPPSNDGEMHADSRDLEAAK